MFLLTWKSRVGFFRTKMLLTQTAHNTCLHRRRTGNFFQCAVRRIVSQPGQKEEVLYIVRTVCVKWPLIVMFSSFFSEDSLIILLFCFHLACLICHNICPKGLFYITQQKTHQPVTPLLVLSRGRAVTPVHRVITHTGLLSILQFLSLITVQTLLSFLIISGLYRTLNYFNCSY